MRWFNQAPRRLAPRHSTFASSNSPSSGSPVRENAIAPAFDVASKRMDDHVYWWTTYLKLIALNTPFGMPVKFTIGVSAYDGERLAKTWRM